MRSLLGAALAAMLSAGAAAPARAFDTFPLPPGWPAYSTTRTAQEQIGPGVSYEHWALSGAQALAAASGGKADAPLSISIITVDLTNPFVALSAASQSGVVQGPGARLSTIADSIAAQAGINGDYFDIGGTGAPLNALVVGGRLLHQPSNAAVFLVDTDKRPHLGPLTWRATVTPADNSPLSISSLNDWTASTRLAMLTDQLGNANAYGATEAVLKPAGSAGAFTVVSVAENLATLASLAQGEIGIAGHGDAAASIAAAFSPDDTVDVSYDGDPPLASIASAVGGGPLLVRGGAVYDDPAAPAPEESNVRYPLTGAGLSANGATLWLVVVDGRRPGVSVGITRPMFGALFIALGAADAMAFDSGGSSEMVVRHAGDPGVSVVTTPSDGRERAIADGLFVVNTAQAGPIAQLVLRAPAPVVLLGSRFAVRAEAVDGNLQPVSVAPASLTWRADPAGALTQDNSGGFVARVPGDATITAASGTISATLAVNVAASIAGLTISGYGIEVPTGAKVPLIANATDAQGRPVVFDADALTWSASSGASITPSGVLVAGSAAAAVTVHAQAGGARASALVNIGDHVAALQRILPVSPAVGAWRFSPSSSAVDGALDEQPAPDGSQSTRLSFRFPAAGSTRAAYLVNDFAIPGVPVALACDVYGDGNGEWIRASYRNADGIIDSVTLARHVDWTGWRTVRADLLPQVRFPVAITRLYVAQADKRAASGELWLRNLAAVYPGP
ncbi:MAG TPA: phosphodiester glycosidase family protein [Candidatus Eremiobacteraceae bacterium]